MVNRGTREKDQLVQRSFSGQSVPVTRTGRPGKAMHLTLRRRNTLGRPAHRPWLQWDALLLSLFFPSSLLSFTACLENFPLLAAHLEATTGWNNGFKLTERHALFSSVSVCILSYFSITEHCRLLPNGLSGLCR